MRSIKTYGGIGGVFIRKKKKTKLCIDSTAATSTSHPSPTIKEGTLIGWDDVRCRPIFEKKKDSNASGSGTPSTEIGSDDDDGDSLLFDENENDSDEETAWNANGRKRLKSYGTRNKKEAFFPETTKLTVVSKKVAAAPRVPSSPKTDSAYHFSSPLVAVNTSICDALDSIQKSDRHEEEQTEPQDVHGMIIKKRRRTCKKLRFDDDDDDGTKQPNSTTSVTAAKAFFDRLDETKLHVAAGTNQPSTVARHSRSVQRVDLGSTDLQREYEDYSRASQESGVPPISLVEYAKNRSDIFRPNEMFDGFLDG